MQPSQLPRRRPVCRHGCEALKGRPSPRAVGPTCLLRGVLFGYAITCASGSLHAHVSASGAVMIPSEASRPQPVTVTGADGKEHALYTTNPVCSKKNCINPLFPAMEDLGRLDKETWTAVPLQKVHPTLSFCKDAIRYDPALPIPADKQPDQQTLSVLSKIMEHQAITMYVYHLQGMGVEFWDHRRPDLSDDECIKTTWKMVCYTYFPKAESGKAQSGEVTKYQRPCASACLNYIKACKVQCCDESVQCVFNHRQNINASAAVFTSGYVDHDAPSPLCTGAAFQSSALTLAGSLMLLAAARW